MREMTQDLSSCDRRLLLSILSSGFIPGVAVVPVAFLCYFFGVSFLFKPE